jgi:hypothetical protein
MKKPGWLKNAIAKPNGYYSQKGELLKSKSLTQAECDEWNGVKAKAPAPAPAPEPTPEPVVEPVAEEVETDESVEEESTPIEEAMEAASEEEDSKPVELNQFKPKRKGLLFGG